MSLKRLLAVTLFALLAASCAGDPTPQIASERETTPPTVSSPIPETGDPAPAAVTSLPSPLPSIPPIPTDIPTDPATQTPVVVTSPVPSVSATAPLVAGAATTTTTPVASPSVAATAVASAAPTAIPAGSKAGAASSNALAEARQKQLVGDCDGARRALAEIIAAAPAPAVASEARFLMAQCYLRDEAPAEAAAVLAELLAQAPAEDPFRLPAQFVLGEAQAALGNWAVAEEAYTGYLKSAPELSYLTWQRIGAARRGAGNLAGAAEAYESAIQISPDWTNTLAIRRAIAALALERKDPASAVKQYDLLRGDTTTGSAAAEMNYLAGVALAESGDKAGAQQRWQAAIDADISSRFAHSAVVALLDAELPVDEYQRGVANWHAGTYGLAIAAFDRLRQSDPTGHGGDAWYYAGRSYFALDDTARGIAELETFIAKFPNNRLWADAWLVRARALAAADRTTEAIATYRELAQLRPDSAQGAQAMWQVALLSDRTSLTPGVAEAYLAFARRYPQAEEAWRAFQNAGLAYYRLGDYRKAADTWQEMAAQTALGAFTRPVARFWQGRALAQMGQKDAALAAWQQGFAAGPESYYGLRSAESYALAAGQPLPGAAAPEVTARPPDAQAERAEVESWLKAWAGEGKLALPQGVTVDADWVRGKALLSVGLRNQALINWERVRQRFAGNPWASAALSFAFRDASANRLSLLAAETVAGLSGRALKDTPGSLQRLAYPLPFENLIRGEAARRGLDARLLAAIIRQESRFETGALSVAGAQGLMQVMPGTAQGIAAQLGWQGFEPKQSNWPYVNVNFGAYYIAQWLTHFGNLPTALAAYNGGPGNAEYWRGLAPDDPELLTALITYNETRVYVQAVTLQYAVYQRLYPR